MSGVSLVHWSQSLVETMQASWRILKHLSFLFGQKPEVGSWEAIASGFELPSSDKNGYLKKRKSFVKKPAGRQVYVLAVHSGLVIPRHICFLQFIAIAI